MEASPTRGRLGSGRVLSLGLPAAVLVFAGASSPWISQRAPRFLFPALAAVGALLVLFSFASSLVQCRRRYHREGRLTMFPVIANAVALAFLVLFPLTRLVGVMTAPRAGPPRILAGFGAIGSAAKVIHG
jgi:NADH:ubiquinone oxidoreductase subunit 6 (subunit J)